MADRTKGETLETLKRVPCEVYSRIVGYLRPVRDWNQGKQQEFSERKTYDANSIPPARATPECTS